MGSGIFWKHQILLTQRGEREMFPEKEEIEYLNVCGCHEAAPTRTCILRRPAVHLLPFLCFAQVMPMSHCSQRDLIMPIVIAIFNVF